MAKKYKFKNNSKQKQAIIGVGEVEAGKVISTNKKIENPNFTMVGTVPVTKPKSKKK